MNKLIEQTLKLKQLLKNVVANIDDTFLYVEKLTLLEGHVASMNFRPQNKKQRMLFNDYRRMLEYQIKNALVNKDHRYNDTMILIKKSTSTFSFSFERELKDLLDC